MPELSMDAKRDLIRGKLDPDNEHNIWIRDLYEKHVVIEDDGKLYEVPYTISDSNEVTLGDRKEVVVTYEALGELKDVEVLKAGTFTSMNGTKVTFSEDDLQEIADNAATLADTIKPPFVATHQEGENASLQAFASVHGGVLHNFRKVGEKLLADIKGVPKKAIALLKEVEEMRVSPEIYNNFNDDEGTAFGKVLRRLSWVDIPAIKSMAGITEANLFEEKPDQPTTWILLSEQEQSKPRKEGKSMPKKTDVSKLSEADILALHEKADQADILLQENADLKKENEGHVSKLSEVETKEKATAIDKIVARFQDKDGKDVLAPAAMDSIKQFAGNLDSTELVKLGEGDNAKEVTALAMFGDLMDNLIQRSDKGTLVVHLGEMAPTETDKGSVDETDADAIASAALEFQESEATAGRDISISSAVNHVTKKK